MSVGDAFAGGQLPRRAPLVTRRVYQRPSKSLAASTPFAGVSSSVMLLNLVTMLFGSNQVLIKTLETDDAVSGAMDSMLCMSLRFGIATLALGAAILACRIHASRSSPQPSPSSSVALVDSNAGETGLSFVAGAVELSVWLFLGFVAQAIGLQYTTASAGALLGSLTVVVVPLLSLLEGRQIVKSTWASVGLALLGTALFVGPGAFDGALEGVGDGLELASAVLFAVQLWRCEKIARGLPEHRLAELTCLQLALVTLLSCACLAFEGWSVPGLLDTMAAWPASEWMQVAVMGLVTTAFCLWAEAQALRDVDAAPAALIYACEPIWGAIFAFLWRGEAPGSPLAIGGGIFLLMASAAGVWATSQGEQNQPCQSPGTQ
eukprot:CAMPEP_0115209088 /NCGR_PEP_ID=MMETSP0270-20121206/21558_1 /TAXON_ID=71861 /ORGANISM="Scrippsiella trochoidea, Strain CCMP3099" /LENGTH=375 /DNA_ID=CAMNT_0002622715 /DNA_START=105 /DNA_END=1232 /DNA_ORIENTATION=+